MNPFPARASIERCIKAAVKFYNELQDEVIARDTVIAEMKRSKYLTPAEQDRIAENMATIAELRHMKSSIVPLITRLEEIQHGSSLS
jgi:hypothetical protein